MFQRTYSKVLDWRQQWFYKKPAPCRQSSWNVTASRYTGRETGCSGWSVMGLEFSLHHSEHGASGELSRWSKPQFPHWKNNTKLKEFAWEKEAPRQTCWFYSFVQLKPSGWESVNCSLALSHDTGLICVLCQVVAQFLHLKDVTSFISRRWDLLGMKKL